MDLVSKIREYLGPEVSKSGASFYSCHNTLRPGKYLIVGLNPGGDPAAIMSTIDQSLVDFLDDSYNAYINQDWNGSGPGKHPIQANLTALFSYLGASFKEVCATNYIFERTKNEDDLPKALYDFYYPIFEWTLNTVKPEIVFLYSKRVLKFLSSKIHIREAKVLSTSHGNWLIYCLQGQSADHTFKIVCLPHLSRYAIRCYEKDLEKVKQACT